MPALKARTVPFTIRIPEFQTWCPVLQAHIARTTIFHQLVSAIIAQQASTARLGPPNLPATAIKDTFALEVNQHRHQQAFSILVHTRTVCLANVL